MGLIIGGREVPCGWPVLDWRETGLRYEVGESPGVTPRKALIDTMVWHWSGAEHPPEKLFANLRRRNLAVEHSIGADGTIYQFADALEADCHDCGRRWDPRSIGVEMVSYGFRWPPWRRWSLAPVPRAGRARPLVETRLNGRRIFVADFTLEQKAAARALARAYTRELAALPWAFCCPSTLQLGAPGSEAADRLYDRALRPWEARRWSGGHIGHLQISTKGKPDPGVRFLEELRAAGPGGEHCKVGLPMV